MQTTKIGQSEFLQKRSSIVLYQRAIYMYVMEQVPPLQKCRGILLEQIA